MFNTPLPIHSCYRILKKQSPRLIFQSLNDGRDGRGRAKSLLDAKIILCSRWNDPTLGEMAVVVYGPSCLVQSTRSATAMVGGERAVHKGTGAQRIYVRVDDFGCDSGERRNVSEVSISEAIRS